VIAATLEQAVDAAELVAVEYEVPAVVDAEAALRMHRCFTPTFRRINRRCIG